MRTDHDDADLRLAALARVCIALLFAATLVAQDVQQGPTLKTRTDAVVVLFRAVDQKLVPVAGLQPNELRLLDNGRPVPIKYFESEVASAHVVALADVSGSMGPVIESLRGGLYTLGDMLSRDTERQAGDLLFSLIPFSERAVVLIDRNPNANAFKQAVSLLQPLGGTSLVDAVIGALEFAFAPKPASDGGRATAGSTDSQRTKFLVIFTDAGENSSRHKWEQILPALQRTGAVIYSIALDSGTIDHNFTKLAQISARSGGRMLLARAGDLDEVYRQVANDIRSHYLATFEAPDEALQDPTKWRSIALTTSRPGVTIFARKGYCPRDDTSCQLSDGSYAEGGELTFEEFSDANRNPALIATLRERLLAVRLRPSAMTMSIARDLAVDTLHVVRRRRRQAADFDFSDHWVSQSRAQIDIDAEACAFYVDKGPAVEGINVTKERVPDTRGRRELVVMSPDLRVAQGPLFTRGQTDRQTGAYVPGERRNQAEAQFQIRDPSGEIASEIRVVCRRPKFLINHDLVELAIRASEHALRATAYVPQP
jgi:VWFA-related protein